MRPDGPPSVQAHEENCTGFGSSSSSSMSSSSVLSALGIIIYGRRRRRRVGGGDDTRRGGLGETGRAATLQHLSHRRLISLNVELTRTRGLCDIHTHTRAYTHVYTRTCAPPQTRVVPYCVDRQLRLCCGLTPRRQLRESLHGTMRVKWLRVRFYRAFSGGCAGAEDARLRASIQPASCNILLVVILHPRFPRTHRAM